MKNSTISKQRSYLTDLFSTLAVKSHRRSTLWLMLFTLLLLPTRMVAQTDYAYAEFDEGTGTLTFKWSNSTSIPTGAYDLNEGYNKPGWYDKREKSIRWSSMLRLPVQDPRAVFTGSMAARIW